MNPLTEAVTKAAQTADQLASDLRAALRSLSDRPEGLDMGDRAVREVVTRQLDKAVKMRVILADMAPGGDPCPNCGELLPDVNASPLICDHCGEEIE